MYLMHQRCSLNSFKATGGRHTGRYHTTILSILAFCGFALYASGNSWSLFKRKLGYGALDLYSAKPGTVVFSPCHNIKNSDCGYVVAPKDYFNASAGTTQIAFARYRATKNPRKGSVMLNPGGPGGSGKDLLLRMVNAEILPHMIGEGWDFIGFDPRGIGETRQELPSLRMLKPAVRCFPDTLTFRSFIANTVLEKGFEYLSIANISDPITREMLVEQNRQFLALRKTQAELCGINMGDELRFMGTANVVRDMDFMTKVFDGDEARINYWGGSYGTILGMYLVNMLPDRVGYVSIDGVADPVSWANEPTHKWHRGWLSSSEATYDIFLSDCAAAGPKLCPLSGYANEPISHIEARIEAFLDELVKQPLSVPLGNRPGSLTSGQVRALLLVLLERPAFWPNWSSYLAEAIKGNGTNLYNAHIPFVGGVDGAASSDMARNAVTCLDSPPPKSPNEYPSAEDLADEMLVTLKTVSPHFGASVVVNEQDGGCQYWPVAGQGPERFTGPWNHTLETPMLIISNTHDPITPIASGLLINSLMGSSSRLLIHDGPGHCSLASPSICTMKVQRDYFNGSIPINGTICTTDMVTFPSSDDENSGALARSEEDNLLLGVARKMNNIYLETYRTTLF